MSIKIARPIGLSTWVKDAGNPIWKICFTESILREIFRKINRTPLPGEDKTFIAIAIKTAWEMSVAYAAPAIPSSGKPNFQKINIGSKIIFIAVEIANNFVNVKVSPSELKANMIFMR